MNILIVCHGFIGDVLFASSIAEKWHEQNVSCAVDYLTPVIQPLHLLQNNPYIRNVYLAHKDIPKKTVYDKIFHLNVVDQSIPATIGFQTTAEIDTPTSAYTVYTDPILDKEFADLFTQRRIKTGKKIIMYPANWIEKSFLFTEEEYWKGVDVPHLGYGGRKHDLLKIILKLSNQYDLFPVGLSAGVGQHSSAAANPTTYSNTASMIKAADVMIGPEGGLTNLAAGVGTPTIITTDFIWQLYGPNGIMKKFPVPAMGPATYFPNAKHLHIQPFADEDEIVTTIDRHIRNELI